MTVDDTPIVSTLSKRARARSVVPFEMVLERHGQGVLRLCVARLGPDRGEEAFQETLIAALRHYGELRDSAAVGGWLFSIARNKIVDSARNRANTAIPSDELEERAAPWQDPDATTGGSRCSRSEQSRSMSATARTVLPQAAPMTCHLPCCAGGRRALP